MGFMKKGICDNCKKEFEWFYVGYNPHNFCEECFDKVKGSIPYTNVKPTGAGSIQPRGGSNKSSWRKYNG